MEHHFGVTKKAIEGQRNGETREEIKRVQITLESGEQISGIFVGKSITIPVATGSDPSAILNPMVDPNLEVLKKYNVSNPLSGLGSVLKISYGSSRDGVTAGSNTYGTVMGLHLYPQSDNESAEGFLNTFRRILETSGAKVEISDTTQSL